MKKEKPGNGPLVDSEGVPSEITSGEMEELLKYFSNYRVKLPDEEEINRTVDALRPYMPRRAGRAFKALFSADELKTLVSLAFSYMNKLYVVFVGVIYLLGYFATRGNGVSPYKTLFILSPLPFILGIMDVIRGREEGMLELEMSCRISARQLAAAKLLLAGIYSMLLNIVLSVVLAYSEPAVSLWRITILWLTPFTFISGVALWITTRIRGYYISGGVAAAWMLTAYTLCLSPEYVKRFSNINIAIFLVLAVAGLAFLAAQFRSFYTHLSFIHEGKDYIET